MLPSTRKRLVFVLVFFFCAVFALAKFDPAGTARINPEIDPNAAVAGSTPTNTPTVIPSPFPEYDLTISQADSPDPVFFNQPLTYTLTVTNSPAALGGNACPNVRFGWPILGPYSFSSASGTNGYVATTNASGVTFTGGCISSQGGVVRTATLTVVLIPTTAQLTGITSLGENVIVDPENNWAENDETNNTATTIHTLVNPGSTPLDTRTPTFTATPSHTITNTPTLTPTATASPVCSPLVLYDQTTDAGIGGSNSQDFEEVFDAFDDSNADDFVVPAGQTWTVSQVAVKGLYYNGLGQVQYFNVTFYHDEATLPGAAVEGGAFVEASYTNNDGVFTITLPEELVLPASRYWVAVQARMDYMPDGQWAWLDRTMTSNSPAVWQNPGGAFNIPACFEYERRGETCGVDPVSPDHVFQILGTGGGTGCVTPTASPTQTETFTPTRTATFTPTPTATATGTPVNVSLPEIYAPPGSLVIVPMSVSNTTGQGIMSYDLQISFDPGVMQPASPAFDQTGTISSGMTITAVTSNAGHLIISASQTGSLSGSGTLLNLRFNFAPIGTFGSLNFENYTDPGNVFHPGFRFNQGSPSVRTTNGFISRPPTPTATVSITTTPVATATATTTRTNTATATASPTPTCASDNYSNTTPIAINDNAAGSPYPSTITVSGLSGTVSNVTAELTGLSHPWPDTIDIMLVGPGGQNTLLMSDAGGFNSITNVDLQFDDGVPRALPDQTRIFSGAYGPSNYDTTTDVFPSPAPSPGVPVAMGVFNGTNPNGVWSLYVRTDSSGGFSGSISGGWRLHISTTAGCVTPTSTATLTPTFTPTVTPTITPTASFTPTATYTATAAATPVCSPVSFSNSATIAIGDNMAGMPYPSTITVSGMTGVISKLSVDLTGVTHTFPDDVDVMLVAPSGQHTLLVSDAGGEWDRANLNLTFDDAAPAVMPNAASLESGTFKPTDNDRSSDLFPSPAPTPQHFLVPGPTALLSTFNRLDPNGIWKLYVRDDTGIDVGAIEGGWTLHITTTGSCDTTPTASPTPTSTIPFPSVTPTETPGGFHYHRFSASTYFEDESQTVPVTILRYAGFPSFPSFVTVSTSNGTAIGGATCTPGVDYISSTQFVQFAEFEEMKTVNINVCADNVFEGDETINLSLLNGDVGDPATAVIKINDTSNRYSNHANIAINGGTVASPYPSTITVTDAPAVIGSVRVTLYDYTCSFPDDTDFLLVGPQGQNFVLMANAGPHTQAGPVTLNLMDAAGVVVPNGGPLFIGDFEPTSYGVVSTFAPGAPPGPYNEPGSNVGGTGTQTFVGNFGGANSNGTWSLYLRNRTPIPNAELVVIGNVAGGWGIDFYPPINANASISGRVTTASGQGIRNARVVVTGGSLSEPIITTTGSFGYFAFEGLATGETYVVTVNSRRYTFSTPSRVISLIDNVIDADFSADPQE